MATTKKNTKETNTTTFQERVYALCRQIPKGKVTTYGIMARALGIKSAQAVGQALKRNPYAPHVPCHRVVSSSGKIGGFMGQRSGIEVERKIKLLRSEGILVECTRINLDVFRFSF